MLHYIMGVEAILSYAIGMGMSYMLCYKGRSAVDISQRCWASQMLYKVVLCVWCCYNNDQPRGKPWWACWSCASQRGKYRKFDIMKARVSLLIHINSLVILAFACHTLRSIWSTISCKFRVRSCRRLEARIATKVRTLLHSHHCTQPRLPSF